MKINARRLLGVFVIGAVFDYAPGYVCCFVVYLGWARITVTLFEKELDDIPF